MAENEIPNISEAETPQTVTLQEEKKSIDIEPIKSLIKDKTSKKLKKGLNQKPKKPSWWVRSRRKKLVLELQHSLKEFGVKKAWVHNHFINAEEKAKNITIYVDISNSNSIDIDAQELDLLMDNKFKKRKITVIDVASLQPAIKEFVFKDVTPLF
jgi:hypothetical protein